MLRSCHAPPGPLWPTLAGPPPAAVAAAPRMAHAAPQARRMLRPTAPQQPACPPPTPLPPCEPPDRASLAIQGLQINLAEAARFAPRVHFHPAEPYLPCSMPFLLQHAQAVDAQGRHVAASDGAAVALHLHAAALQGQGLVGHDARVAAPMYVAVQVPADRSFVDVHYLFIFAYNGPQTVQVHAPGLHFGCVVPHFAEHQGDVEGITVRLSSDKKRCLAVRFEQHGRSQWLPAEALRFVDDHVQVYCGLHSHATFSGMGAQAAGGRDGDSYYVNGGGRLFGSGVEAVDRISDAGPRWTPYASDNQLIFVGGNDAVALPPQRAWEQFAGRLGQNRTNALAGVHGVGRPLRLHESMLAHLLARSAWLMGVLRRFGSGHAPPGFAGRAFMQPLAEAALHPPAPLR